MLNTWVGNMKLQTTCLIKYPSQERPAEIANKTNGGVQ
jgi:hypothetical protein